MRNFTAKSTSRTTVYRTVKVIFRAGYRVGVKGKAPLSETISIIYQIEQEVDPIHGGLNADELFSMRNTFVGLKLISENSFSATTTHR